jgi:hypothetical protein
MKGGNQRFLKAPKTTTFFSRQELPIAKSLEKE